MFPTEAISFAQLFEKSWLIVLIISLGNSVILYFSSLKFLLVLQQSGYRGKRYFNWLSNRDTPYLSRLMLLCLLALLFFCVLAMCFSSVVGNAVGSFVGFASYILFAIAYINTESHVNAKIPLKKTRRLVRLAITYLLVLIALTFGLLTLLNYLAFIIGDEVVALLRFSVICLMPLLTPYVLYLSSLINEPLEFFVRRHYIRRAKNKLDNTDVIRIGVTGSYGKTTVKEILKTLLSQKYRVLATPESYNTPLGVSLTAKNLDGTHDIFICEMGARSSGDIKELTLMVKPQYGVLTGVNAQHLESFRTIENVRDTKYELFKFMGKGGKGFFSSDNKISTELKEWFSGEESYLAGVSGGIVTATDIEINSQGSSFTLNVEGEEPVKCNTVLLGKHTISNICLAAAVAYKIGLSPIEIANGINRLRSIGHRLELLPNNKNIVIIDDSYNANIDGVKSAMEVLDLFEGRKIVLTPGLVELGKDENVANFEFGKILSAHADKVIIIGRHNALMLINGLIEGGFDRSNIVFVKSLKKGNEALNQMLCEGDVVLFENDLPDNYN
ncbi:MAG: UDP-N-acetylmuramoyl-tripeptide--D-alanyl-D-alanine ligase [Clostridiales bacterium]|nr:UDP-N-acetylmuramoyl-tripeptide--D-alanyl-D-alanine ligase [Clostridiales bacterium]